MLVDFHANYYAKMAASGNATMFEDDEFDLDKIMADLEAQADPADEWEEVENWSVDQPGELPAE